MKPVVGLGIPDKLVSALPLIFAGFIDRDLIEKLLKECVKMYKFDHPNVIKLLGVCLDGGPVPFIVMPFMTNGSLLAYLKGMRGVLVLDPTVQQDNMVRSLGGCHFIHKTLSRYQ